MHRIIFPAALALLLAACAAPQTVPTALASPPAATNPPLVQTETPPTAATEMAPAEATALEAQPIPTYRGDALSASDPAQVNLSAGRPALVEFFRFT
ncbi:MAG: hypothetical protein RBS68_08535 [Anaerolineales bacterium]|jgi:hypothetical protein|nr:hypothetical protein [Anaerolineales bacterium]